ncbi:hypothetical protein C8R46DRAFT_1040214 [Mycena filopes]|nr:hypothetical protein C8R46DRAFT_1040214 [Mycena filopes]
MSLTLLWSDGQTYAFESRAKVRSRVEYKTRVESQLRKNVYVLRTMESQTQLVLKMARDAGGIAALELEASFYINELKSLQGTAVPWFYGIYHGHIDGVPVACMLLEYRRQVPVIHPGREVSILFRFAAVGQVLIPPSSRRVMLAACAVHAAGVMHCDLENGRQFVLSGKNIKIVDFSCAIAHRCPGATPTLHPGMGSAPTGCQELLMLEESHGIHSGASFPIVNAPLNCLPEGNPLQVLARKFVGMMG